MCKIGYVTLCACTSVIATYRRIREDLVCRGESRVRCAIRASRLAHRSPRLLKQPVAYRATLPTPRPGVRNRGGTGVCLEPCWNRAGISNRGATFPRVLPRRSGERAEGVGSVNHGGGASCQFRAVPYHTGPPRCTRMQRMQSLASRRHCSSALQPAALALPALPAQPPDADEVARPRFPAKASF